MANLITNPTFEANTTGWSATGTASIARSSTQAYQGSWSLRVTNAAANDGCGWQRSVVSAGTLYYISAWLWLDSTEQVGVGWNEFTSADGYIATRQTQPSVTGGGWTKVETSFTTDVTAGKIDPFFAIRNTGVDFYMDEPWVDTSAQPPFSATSGLTLLGVG